MTESNMHGAYGSGIATPETTADAAPRAETSSRNKPAEDLGETGTSFAPSLDRVSEQAQKLLQLGREAIHDTTDQVREKVAQAADMAVGYTKDEPLKAMLMAAAVGAVLMGLVGLMARSRES